MTPRLSLDQPRAEQHRGRRQIQKHLCHPRSQTNICSSRKIRSVARGGHQQKPACRVVSGAAATTTGGGGGSLGTNNPRLTADKDRDPDGSSPADADGLLARVRCET